MRSCGLAIDRVSIAYRVGLGLGVTLGAPGSLEHEAARCCSTHASAPALSLNQPNGPQRVESAHEVCALRMQSP